MSIADKIAQMWFRHPITIQEPPQRTARGTTSGETHSVHGSINVQARTVTTPDGEEVTAAGTLCWHVDGYLPPTGSTITLPDEFGLKPNREVITATRAHSGTGITPDHIEVTIR